MRGLLFPALLTALSIGCSTPDTLDVAPVFAAGSSDERELAESLATEHLDRVKAAWNIDTVGDFRPARVVIDDLLSAHVRFQQTFEGVPVFGGEAIVHLDAWGDVTTLTDNVVPGIKIGTSPVVFDDEAVDIAVDAAGGWERTSTDPEAALWILRHEG